MKKNSLQTTHYPKTNLSTNLFGRTFCTQNVLATPLTKHGFSTLFIVIILGAISLSLVFSLSASSVWSIKGSTDTKNANKAKALVNSCAEVALEVLRENNNYTGTNNVILDGNTCTYTVLNTGGTTRSVAVSGSVSGVTRKLNIITGTFNPLVVSSWQEVQ
ncbi:MAG: hypothetical protein WCJ74_01060 [bacterium]